MDVVGHQQTKGQAGNARAALVGLTLFCLLFGLGNHGLFEDNEARFFEISWEMAQSGDWVTPRLNFIKHFHKPPLTYWLVGSSIHLFGATEWAGRLPVALSALVCLGCIWLLARHQLPDPVALASVLVLGTTLEFWLLGRMVLTDGFLACTVAAALLFAWRALQEPEHGRAWLGFWLAMGASMMVKGPVGPAIVGLTLLGFHLSGGRWANGWRALKTLPGLLVFLAVALPWYLLVALRNPGLLEYFIIFQTVERVGTTVHGRSGPIWFYLPVILTGWFPWSVALPQALKRSWSRRHHPWDRFLMCWLALPLVMFSLAGSKLPTYILPLVPALALLIAPVTNRLTPALGIALGFFGLAAGAWNLLALPPELEPARVSLLSVSGLALTGAAVALAFRRRGHPQLYFLWCVATQCAVLLSLTFGLGRVGDHYSAKPVAVAVKALDSHGAPVVECADHLHGLPFYLGQRVAHLSYPRETQFEREDDLINFYFTQTPAAFLQTVAAEHRPIIVIRKSDYDPVLFSAYQTTECGRHLVLSLPSQDTQSGAP